MNKKAIILETAATLFSEKGFRETSMAELSKITGAAEGTIFYHFKSKEELFVAILEELKKTIVEEFEDYFRKNELKTGLEMVEGAASFYLLLSTKMEDRFLLLHRHDPYELAQSNSVCRRHLEDIYNCFVNIFEKAILRGQEDGSVDRTPARKTALIIFSMVDGLVRFNTYSLYDAGALYRDLIEVCRRILQNHQVTSEDRLC
jgi:AcrR family transcriptional regulator